MLAGEDEGGVQAAEHKRLVAAKDKKTQLCCTEMHRKVHLELPTHIIMHRYPMEYLRFLSCYWAINYPSFKINLWVFRIKINSNTQMSKV